MEDGGGRREAGASRPTLNQKVISAVMWTAAQSWGVQSIGFVIFLVLARLLEPSAFGLIALAGVYIHLSSIFVDQGLSTAIIQRREVEPEHLDAAFWMSAGVGSAMMGIGIALSGHLATLFNEPGLQPVIAWLSINFVFTSLNGVQSGILRREFAFRVLAIRSLVATLFGGATGIWLALNGFGVMALVGQQLVMGGVGVVLLWSTGRWRPRFRFSPVHARELVSFSGHVLGIRILNVASRRSDDLLIGFFLGSVALGYYAVAYRMFRVLLDLLGKVFTKVAVPAFASIQDDTERVRAALYRGLSFVALGSLPVFAYLGVMAPEVVEVFFGEKWAQSAPVMSVLAALGIIQILYVLVNQTMIALGRPGLTLSLLAASTMLSVVGFSMVVQQGIVAVALVFAGVGYLMMPVYAILLHRLIGFEPLEFLRHCRGPIGGVVAMLASIAAVHAVLQDDMTGRGILLATLGAAAPVYIAAVLLIQPELGRDIRDRLRSGVRKPGGRRTAESGAGPAHTTPA